MGYLQGSESSVGWSVLVEIKSKKQYCNGCKHERSCSITGMLVKPELFVIFNEEIICAKTGKKAKPNGCYE